MDIFIHVYYFVDIYKLDKLQSLWGILTGLWALGIIYESIQSLRSPILNISWFVTIEN